MADLGKGLSSKYRSRKEKEEDEERERRALDQMAQEFAAEHGEISTSLADDQGSATVLAPFRAAPERRASAQFLARPPPQHAPFPAAPGPRTGAQFPTFQPRPTPQQAPFLTTRDHRTGPQFQARSMLQQAPRPHHSGKRKPNPLQESDSDDSDTLEQHVAKKRREGKGVGAGDDDLLTRLTIRISNIPRSKFNNGTLSEEEIKQAIFRLLPVNIQANFYDQILYDFRRDTPSAPKRHAPSQAVIIILSHTSNTTVLSNIVKALNGAYYGWGFYLTASQHVSMQGSDYNRPTRIDKTEQRPFGTNDFSTKGPGNMSDNAVYPEYPTNLELLKLIHQTIEQVITHGPGMEELLMQQQWVQTDETWAFIWPTNNKYHKYYRFRLNDIAHRYYGAKLPRDRRNPQYRVQLFHQGGQGDIVDPWVLPIPLKFEFVYDCSQFIANNDYDLARNPEQNRPNWQKGADGVVRDVNQKAYFLGPLRKTQLTWLLANLPFRKQELDNFDVAAITDFAGTYVDNGSQEIVEMLLDNVVRPFNTTSARDPDLDEKPNNSDLQQHLNENMLSGVYLISDLVSNSARLGSSYRWVQAVMAAFRDDRNFMDFLGRAPYEHRWSRFTLMNWENELNGILDFWYKWTVFSDKTFVPEVHSRLKKVIKSGQDKEGGADPWV